MARPLRLELAGALYHVTSRGDGREDIYQSDEDRLAWLDTLAQVCERFQPGEANLVRKIDILAPIATGRDVVERAGEFEPEGAGHGSGRITLRCEYERPWLLRALESGQHRKSMLLNHGKQSQRHATRAFSAGLPFLHGGFAGIQIARKDRLAYVIELANFFICCGLTSVGAARHAKSKLRIVALLMAPTLYNALAEE